MSLITSDIIIKGKHATTIKQLVQKGLFKEQYEVFIHACLLGLYCGKKSEMDASTNEKVEISRTIWDKRYMLENALFIFLQHQKVYEDQPLDVSEVFNMTLESANKKVLLEELKQYAYFGLEKLEEIYANLGTAPDIDTVLQISENTNFLSKDELDSIVREEFANAYKAHNTKEEVDSLIDQL